MTKTFICVNIFSIYHFFSQRTQLSLLELYMQQVNANQCSSNCIFGKLYISLPVSNGIPGNSSYQSVHRKFPTNVTVTGNA